jgi:hypothetical protein
MRFRRQGFKRDAANGLAADSGAIDRVLARDAGSQPADEQSFDLEALVVDLFDDAPTSDIRSLRDRGVDGSAFFDAELRPNWERRSQGERSAKIEAFMRLANVLGADDPGGIGALVRTKVLVLAWAYDRLYEQGLSRQLARKPQSFGRLELREDARA